MSSSSFKKIAAALAQRIAIHAQAYLAFSLKHLCPLGSRQVAPLLATRNKLVRLTLQLFEDAHVAK